MHFEMMQIIKYFLLHPFLPLQTPSDLLQGQQIEPTTLSALKYL